MVSSGSGAQLVVTVEGRVRPRWGKEEVLKLEDLGAP